MIGKFISWTVIALMPVGIWGLAYEQRKKEDKALYRSGLECMEEAVRDGMTARNAYWQCLRLQ